MKIVYTGEADSRLFKNELGKKIADLLETDEKVLYLDADLMNCIATGDLPKKTDRAIDCGIAEANMVGVACGASATGMKPIVHSFGPFVSRRSYDQIFLSGGYAGNDITIIGTDPGIAASFNGGTHMPFEDIALYRALPGAVICDVTDVPMMKWFLEMSVNRAGVKYMRVGRKESRQVYEDGARFEVGKGCVLREGSDAVIIASGIMVHEALQAAQELEQQGICAAVIDPVTIKPLDRELIRDYAAKTGTVVTAENHNIIGGLYSAVRDCIGREADVAGVAVEDTFGEVGPQDYLRERFALTDTRIAETVKALLAQKKGNQNE